MIRLVQKINSKENNFNFLRFLAASLVIISHTFPLYGSKEFVVGGYDTLGGLAVATFFLLSGFLITKSWQDNPKIIAFFKKRILRIIPALIPLTLLIIFIIGPFVTTLNSKQYFENPLTLNYMKNIFLFPIQDRLPGVFVNNPFPQSVNGSLWTLPVEFFMYFSIAIIGLLGLFSKRIFVPAFLVIMLFLDSSVVIKPEYQKLVILSFMPAVLGLRFAIFFFIGSFIYIYSDKIYLDFKLVILALAAFILLLGTSYLKMAGYFILPYLIIYFAFNVEYSIFRNFGKYGDFSYGMYIYAFPIQQTLMYYFGKNLNPITFFAYTFMITLFLAAISWYLIEKPSLRLKRVNLTQNLFANLKKK